MTDPFERFSIDGTEASMLRLVIAEQLFLKALPMQGLPHVVALRLESPVSETSGEKTVQQWALSRDQAEFLIRDLQKCIDSLA